MTLAQLRYVITVSQVGTLSEAAKRLYISQPSLTNAIKELEKELKYNFSSSTEDYKYLEIDENQKVIFKDGKWYLNEVEDEYEISRPKIENKEIKYEFIKNK